MTNSFADFAKAKMFLVIGSNMTEAHPVAATFVKQAQIKGAQLIVVDPRRTDLAELADLHLPLKVGTDVALLNGLMQVLVTENLYDQQYVNSCTVGFEALKAKVLEYPPERAAEIAGLSAEMIREVARRLAAVQKEFPKAALLNQDDVSVIYLVADAPDKYHKFALADPPSGLMTRKQMLTEVFVPLRKIGQQLQG